MHIPYLQRMHICTVDVESVRLLADPRIISLLNLNLFACSVLRGGPILVPFADVLDELRWEARDIRASVKLHKVDKELHAINVRIIVNILCALVACVVFHLY